MSRVDTGDLVIRAISSPELALLPGGWHGGTGAFPSFIYILLRVIPPAVRLRRAINRKGSDHRESRSGATLHYLGLL